MQTKDVLYSFGLFAPCLAFYRESYPNHYVLELRRCLFAPSHNCDRPEAGSYREASFSLFVFRRI